MTKIKVVARTFEKGGVTKKLGLKSFTTGSTEYTEKIKGKISALSVCSVVRQIGSTHN